MHVLTRQLIITICTAGLLLGSLFATAGRGTPAVAATPSGVAYAWGNNDGGQLGNGTMKTTNNPTPEPAALPSGVTVTAVAAGKVHSLAIGSDGKVYSWGYNGFGQLGDGTTFDSSTPLAITLASGVTATAIAAGSYHSLAIGSNGTVYTWGSNSSGQLGNGTTNESDSPAAITLASGVTATAIAGGGAYSLAIGSNGKVYAWGFNSDGQLGNGTTTSSSTPVAITLASGVTATAIAAGAYHSLAIGSDGKVYSWGYNGGGELGNGTTTSSSTPMAITLASGVTPRTIAAGTSHSLAIGSNGTVYAWGFNNNGQLGNGTTTMSLTPVAITLASGVTATAVAAGYAHSLGIGSNGRIYAWGSNSAGQLGNGMSNTSPNPTPAMVNLPSGKIALALGTGSQADHSLAILTSAPTAAILSRFRVIHAGNALLFHWRVASGAGIRGFFLTAGTHRLNRWLIQSHAQHSRYAYVSRWQGHGPYLLHGVLPGGAVVTLASTG